MVEHFTHRSFAIALQRVAHGRSPPPLKDDAWLFWITTSTTSPARGMQTVEGFFCDHMRQAFDACLLSM